VREIEVRRRRFDEATVEWAKRTVEDPSVPEDSWAYYRARRTLSAVEAAGQVERAEVVALRVGSLGMVGLPGEIFCEIGLDIKRRSPAEFTAVAELTGDNLGYVPTKQAFSEGGYEVESAIWEEELGAKLADAASDLLEDLFGD